MWLDNHHEPLWRLDAHHRYGRRHAVRVAEPLTPLVVGDVEAVPDPAHILAAPHGPDPFVRLQVAKSTVQPALQQVYLVIDRLTPQIVQSVGKLVTPQRVVRLLQQARDGGLIS